MKQKNIALELFDILPVVLLPLFYAFCVSGKFWDTASNMSSIVSVTPFVFLFAFAFYSANKIKHYTLCISLISVCMVCATCLVPMTALCSFPVVLLFIVLMREKQEHVFVADLLACMSLLFACGEGTYFAIVNINYSVWLFQTRDFWFTAGIFVFCVLLYTVFYLGLKKKYALSQKPAQNTKNTARARKVKLPYEQGMTNIVKTELLWILVLNFVCYLRSDMRSNLLWVSPVLWALFFGWYIWQTHPSLRQSLSDAVRRLQAKAK